MIKSIALHLPASPPEAGTFTHDLSRRLSRQTDKEPGTEDSLPERRWLPWRQLPPGRDHAMFITTHCQASASHLSLCQVLHCLPQLQALNSSYTRSTHNRRAAQTLQSGHRCSTQPYTEALLRDLLISCPRNRD